MNKAVKSIDPKYGIAIEKTQLTPAAFSVDPVIVKISTGEPIPDDEPKILFRARDRNALEMLHYYYQLCERDGCTEFHMDGIADRIDAFERFATEHPERMKQPGITRGI